MQKKSRKSVAEPSASVMYHTISSIINKAEFFSKYPPFPHNYYLIADLNGGKHLVLEKNGEVHYVSETSLVSDISQYCIESGIFDPQTPVFCQQAFKFWYYSTKAIEYPLFIADKNEKKRSFARLDFDADPNLFTEFPETFISILERCSQPEALCAFIGSLFYPQADKQQYLYCYGDGQDSKGTLLRFIHKLLGTSCQFLEAPQRGDRFFNFRLLNKRVAIMADCEDSKFFSSARFKSLTGGDPVYIEEKGKSGYTAKLETKWIVGSNDYPELTGSKSDMRRIVFVEFEGVPDCVRNTQFEKLLIEDARTIVSGCKKIYMEMCPDHGPIDCKPPSDVVSDNEDHYLNILDENFLITGRDVDKIIASDIVRCLSHHKIRGGKNIKRVKNIWFRAHPEISYQRTSTTRSYVGIRFKDSDLRRRYTNSLTLVNDD